MTALVNEVGSTFLAALSLVSMWLISRGRPFGWVIAIAAQVAWVPYDLLTRQYGFLALTAASVPVYWCGWLEFHRRMNERISCRIMEPRYGC